eukprot:403372806
MNKISNTESQTVDIKLDSFAPSDEAQIYNLLLNENNLKSSCNISLLHDTNIENSSENPSSTRVSDIVSLDLKQIDKSQLSKYNQSSLIENQSQQSSKKKSHMAMMGMINIVTSQINLQQKAQSSNLGTVGKLVSGSCNKSNKQPQISHSSKNVINRSPKQQFESTAFSKSKFTSSINSQYKQSTANFGTTKAITKPIPVSPSFTSQSKVAESFLEYNNEYMATGIVKKQNKKQASGKSLSKIETPKRLSDISSHSSIKQLHDFSRNSQTFKSSSYSKNQTSLRNQSNSTRQSLDRAPSSQISQSAQKLRINPINSLDFTRSGLHTSNQQKPEKSSIFKHSDDIDDCKNDSRTYYNDENISASNSVTPDDSIIQFDAVNSSLNDKVERNSLPYLGGRQNGMNPQIQQHSSPNDSYINYLNDEDLRIINQQQPVILEASNSNVQQDKPSNIGKKDQQNTPEFKKCREFSSNDISPNPRAVGNRVVSSLSTSITQSQQQSQNNTNHQYKNSYGFDIPAVAQVQCPQMPNNQYQSVQYDSNTMLVDIDSKFTPTMTQSQLRIPQMQINVNLGKGNYKHLIVYQDEDMFEKIYLFTRDNNFNEKRKKKFYEVIRQHIAKQELNQQQQQKEQEQTKFNNEGQFGGNDDLDGFPSINVTMNYDNIFRNKTQTQQQQYFQHHDQQINQPDNINSVQVNQMQYLLSNNSVSNNSSDCKPQSNEQNIMSDDLNLYDQINQDNFKVVRGSQDQPILSKGYGPLRYAIQQVHHNQSPSHNQKQVVEQQVIKNNNVKSQDQSVSFSNGNNFNNMFCDVILEEYEDDEVFENDDSIVHFQASL